MARCSPLVWDGSSKTPTIITQENRRKMAAGIPLTDADRGVA
ncbi:MAG: hypothetical protein WB799_11380 [Candidatus Sulfotelmatobacter sp.]